MAEDNNQVFLDSETLNAILYVAKKTSIDPNLNQQEKAKQTILRALATQDLINQKFREGGDVLYVEDKKGQRFTLTPKNPPIT